MNVRRLLLLLFLTAQLVSCAAARSPLEGEAAESALVAFAAGETELPCRLACAGRWGWVSRDAKMLYQTEQWTKLANLVSKIGYDDQLTWYYLGRAAEELGHYKAARNYYLQSKFAIHPCKLLIDNCDGFVFPAAADAGLRSIATFVEGTSESDEPEPILPLGSNRQRVEERQNIPAQEVDVNDQSRYATSEKSIHERIVDEEHGPYPENYRELIRDHFKSILFDPYSAVYEFFEPIKFNHEIKGQIRSLWAACGTVNAKNRYGGYVGVKLFCAYIRNGQILDTLII